MFKGIRDAVDAVELKGISEKFACTNLKNSPVFNYDVPTEINRKLK